MKKALLALVCAMSLALSGCAPAPADASAVLAPAEADRLVIYTSHKEEVYGPIVKEFQSRTGIWAEVVTGGTNELLERISGQRGTPACDVMFGGGVESLMAYADCFEPYTCSGAEMIKPALRPEGDVWTPFSSLPVVLIYNTKLVSPETITGWEDLLGVRWRGKIAFADPAVSGSSYTAALTMLSCLPGEDREVLARFVGNLDGRVLPDSGDVAAAVADGSLSVGVTLEETALKWIARGAEIAVVYPKEGTSNLPDATALIEGAPHMDNAKAFLEFVQSEEVQALVVSSCSRRSVRQDVADREDLKPTEELRVVDYDVAWASEIKEGFLAYWAELNEGAAP